MNNIKVKLGLPDYKDLLRYGNIVSDNEYRTKDGYIRVRKIEYMGIVYYLKMIKEEVVTLKQWDELPYNEDALDISKLSDEELANMLMFSDRDRKENNRAEKVYWLCINEINARLDENTRKD